MSKKQSKEDQERYRILRDLDALAQDLSLALSATSTRPMHEACDAIAKAHQRLCDLNKDAGMAEHAGITLEKLRAAREAGQTAVRRSRAGQNPKGK
jgi:hypothetical protein